ncbi:MAG: hypothetical protein EPO26_17695 [Chloroflexota bacterium]|nr:MAG: hypothetical protein EPO26_17695 [Chloroflexota bacterium]
MTGRTTCATRAACDRAHHAITSFSLALAYAVHLVWQVQNGLTPLQLVLVGTMLEVTAFPCEIRTGIVADVYSRRLSVIIGVFLHGVAILVEGFARGRSPTFARLIAVASIAQIAAVAVFALWGNVWVALAMNILIHVAREVHGPLRSAWFNQGIDPRYRATVLSMEGQVDALGQIGGGPLVGAGSVFGGLRAALLDSATLLVPVLPVLSWAVRRTPSRYAVSLGAVAKAVDVEER